MKDARRATRKAAASANGEPAAANGKRAAQPPRAPRARKQSPLHIGEAIERLQLEAVRRLLREYLPYVVAEFCRGWLTADIAGLPGAYAPPRGRWLLAKWGRAAVGCVALRPLEEHGIAEIKRLFVRPKWQGRGIGRGLVLAALEKARELGYSVVRLDTLPEMEAAIGLYRDLGFREIDPYGPVGDAEVEGARYFEIDLADLAHE